MVKLFFFVPELYKAERGIVGICEVSYKYFTLTRSERMLPCKNDTLASKHILYTVYYVKVY